MPLPQLLESLERDAREEAERLAADSRAEARAILDRARTRAAELAEGPVREASAAAAMEAERLRAHARVRHAAALRAVCEGAVQDALAEVRSELERVRERQDYAELLRALAAEARELLPAAEILAVDPRDAEAAQAIAHAWGVQVETSYSGWGGVVLADGRGRSVRNTLEERLAGLTTWARGVVVSALEESR